MALPLLDCMQPLRATKQNHDPFQALSPRDRCESRFVPCEDRFVRAGIRELRCYCRWRDVERVEGGCGDNPPVDATNTLPDGRKFSGPREFKKLLAANEKRLAHSFVEHLATYALRRVTTVDDEEQLQAIVRSASKDGYGVRTLVRGLVSSDLFRQR